MFYHIVIQNVIYSSPRYQILRISQDVYQVFPTLVITVLTDVYRGTPRQGTLPKLSCPSNFIYCVNRFTFLQPVPLFSVY